VIIEIITVVMEYGGPINWCYLSSN